MCSNPECNSGSIKFVKNNDSYCSESCYLNYLSKIEQEDKEKKIKLDLLLIEHQIYELLLKKKQLKACLYPEVKLLSEPNESL